MKLQLTVIACALLLSSHAIAEEKLELKTQKDKLGYAIGLDLGKNLKKNEVDVDLNVIMRGIKDGFGGGNALMTDDQVKETYTAFQQERIQKVKAEGDAFLAANKKKDGVITMASGLQYKIIKNGSGKTPRDTDSVTVNYRGTFINGNVFDQGQGTTLNVNGVIPGWTEALKLMKEGSKWELFIPANLAYGERGTPGIPPNSVLLFEVELLSVHKGQSSSPHD